MSKGKATPPFAGAKGKTGAPAGTTPARPRPAAVVPRRIAAAPRRRRGR
ncbi:MAG: hypothetical protein IPI40_07740 [Betaproteobacteria bacterium]|nr:hypothetical protein [Betaproteobacteria bacterium]